MAFAAWIYRLAGIYGILVTAPLFVSEQRLAVMFPPRLVMPEPLNVTKSPVMQPCPVAATVITLEEAVAVKGPLRVTVERMGVMSL